MAENSNISWTDHTFNPWIGCTKVSPGCSNCYAATQDNLRKWTPEGWGKGKPRKRTSEANWRLPLKWNRLAADNEAFHASEAPLHDDGEFPDYQRPRVFCASLADWLDDEVPREWQTDLLRLVEATPNLDWLLLTKRPTNWEGVMTNALLDGVEMVHEWVNGRPPANVWIGTTVEDQQRAEERIPELLNIPARVRFLSCEPLLERINIQWEFDYDHHGETRQSENIPEGIHWVIAGGESGPGFRPFNPDWARSLRDQCKAAGVAFHMKQMGGLRPSTMPPIPSDLQIQEFPK